MTFPLDLDRSDLRAIGEALDKGLITNVSLVEECFRRIERDNKNGKQLRVVLELAPVEQSTGHTTWIVAKRGPLHGIPVMPKYVRHVPAEALLITRGSIRTEPALGMTTTGGSPALLQSIPKANAPIVQSLVDAGMIVLGKANLTMLNGWYAYGLPDGWSALGGQTHSAFGPDVDVGGSSSGSAVAVSTGMSPASLGIETCGSITIPASLAGIYAIKPSLGLLSTKGMTPNCPKFDTPGPMGKSVYDIAVLLDALVHGPTSYLDDLGKDTAELKIATLNQREHPLTPEEHDLYHAAIAALGKNVQQDPVRVDVLQDMIESEAIETLWAAYSQGVWAEYLAHVDEGNIKTLAQLVDWHDSHPAESFHPKHPGQEYLRRGLKYPVDPSDLPEVKAAQRLCDTMTAQLKAIFETRGVDVLMYCGPYDWPTAVGSTSGYPVGIAPYIIKKDGTPFSLAFIGRPNDETTVLKAMAMCEKLWPNRPIPLP